MLKPASEELPCDIAIFTAAVADWRVAAETDEKIKKDKSGIPDLKLVENPGHSANHRQAHVEAANARRRLCGGDRKRHRECHEKLAAKGCDLIVANDVSPERGVIGGEQNTVHLVSAIRRRKLAAYVQAGCGAAFDGATREATTGKA